MSVRQYVVSDPQQQIDKACIKKYKVVRNDRSDRYHEMETKDFETQFRPLQTIKS